MNKLSNAGKMELIMELLGGRPIYDDDGNEIGKTPQIITKEEALELLKG